MLHTSSQNAILRLAFTAWIIASESLKVIYITTCDCQSLGQPFNAWFFPAFQHLPYTSWFTFHGITWLAGPYSLLWWGLNSPAVFGYYPFFAWLLTCDIFAFYVFQKKNRVYAGYYLALTLWFTTVDPVDFFPVVFAVAGRYRAVFLFLAPLTKLPVGASLWVWEWTFTNANSFSGPENYGRYLILGCVWIFSLLLFLDDKTHGFSNIRSRLPGLDRLRFDRPTPSAG